ncbi:MRPL25 [[Candida] subhashii]|uniref:MRPL25 n=1 Tax=[Candida] subhashii TaxID=561895 RepID=A0A8J5QG49_9ASCO|nr:MRPL25 [[Candida] subhashii]KAG7663876.1 MRPL25 [[Candida] subhashii]
MSLTPKEAFAKLPQKLHKFFMKYPPRPFAQYADKPSTVDDPLKNPFMPNKTKTGVWHTAKYSRRRSADLYKLAYKFGIHTLLPPTPRKFYEDKYENKNWMRGVLYNKKSKRERERPEKLASKEEALAKMDETILAARPEFKKKFAKLEEKRKKAWY